MTDKFRFCLSMNDGRGLMRQLFQQRHFAAHIVECHNAPILDIMAWRLVLWKRADLVLIAGNFTVERYVIQAVLTVVRPLFQVWYVVPA